MTKHLDRNGNTIDIKKNNVVVIHNKTWGMGLFGWGIKKGHIGVVKEWGCVEVQVHSIDKNPHMAIFNCSDLEVIGTL